MIVSILVGNVFWWAAFLISIRFLMPFEPPYQSQTQAWLMTGIIIGGPMLGMAIGIWDEKSREKHSERTLP